MGQSPSVVNPYRPDPMTQQFSFGFQYAFSPNDVLDVNYVGSRGRRITLGGMNYGQLDPKYLSMGSALNDPLPQSICQCVELPGAYRPELPVHGGAIADAVSGVLRRRLSASTNRSESTTTTHCRQTSSIVSARD